MKIEIITLDEKCLFINGGAWKQTEYADYGVPVVQVKDMQGGTVIWTQPKFLPESSYQRYSQHQLETNDLVIATVGSHPDQPNSVVGKATIIPQYAEGALLNQNAVCIRPKDSTLDKRYLGYIGKSPELQHFIAAMAKGAANQVRIAIGALKQFPFNLPPLEVQQRIADILSNYDRLIDNNNRRIALLEESIHQLYKEWFVRSRFPGYESVKIVDGIPEGWQNSTIGDAFTIIGGGTPSKNIQEYWQDGTITWYSPTDLTKSNTMFMEKSGSQITSVGLANSSARLFPPFSVMMTSRATIGVVSINTTEACTNQGFITCIPNDKISLYFLYCWIKANIEIFYNLASGATFKEISKGIFKKISIIIPDPATINKFEDKAKAYGSLILILQRENQYLYEARDLLLPRLMNGSIAV